MRVYHFLDAKWAEDDLSKRRLKISRFDDLNDPFELLAPELKERSVRQAFQALRDHMCAKCGVLCFSLAWHNPLLWSHYADKHRGICFGFDVPDGHILQVRYDSKRLVGVVPRLVSRDANSQALMKRLLATKFKDWKYEDEIRVYTDLSDVDAATGHYFKEFAADLALKEVIFGARYPGSVTKIPALARACSSDVSLVAGRLAFGTFRVVHDKSRVV